MYMETKARIRLFLPACDPFPDKRTFADTGFELLLALERTSFGVRAINTLISGMVFDPFSRWHLLASHFQGDLDSSYVNVVCGSKDEIPKFFTANIPNIAVTDKLDEDTARKWDHTFIDPSFGTPLTGRVLPPNVSYLRFNDLYWTTLVDKLLRIERGS